MMEAVDEFTPTPSAGGSQIRLKEKHERGELLGIDDSPAYVREPEGQPCRRVFIKRIGGPSPYMETRSEAPQHGWITLRWCKKARFWRGCYLPDRYIRESVVGA
jgi:hypothetical protein